MIEVEASLIHQTFYVFCSSLHARCPINRASPNLAVPDLNDPVDLASQLRIMGHYDDRNAGG